MVQGRRVTDTETLDVITMVYAGLINKNIVADVGYKINLLNGTNGDNEVVAGLTYQF